MASNAEVCVVHRDRRAEGALGSCGYCAPCLAEIAAAVRALPPGVAPRACYAEQRPAGAWRGLSGNGAAHWLAHELQLRPVHAHARCAAGSPIRRADLLLGRRELVRELPAPRDLWLDLDEEGCGLVVAVRHLEGPEVEISIRGLIGPAGSLATRDFYRDLSGRGRFFR